MVEAHKPALSYAQRQHLRDNGNVPPELLRDFYGAHSPTESHGRSRGNTERQSDNTEPSYTTSGDLLPSQPLILLSGATAQNASFDTIRL